MNKFTAVNEFSSHLLKFAQCVGVPKEEHPYRIPANVDVAVTLRDPSDGVEVMVVLMDGEHRFYMHQVDLLIRDPRVPEKAITAA